MSAEYFDARASRWRRWYTSEALTRLLGRGAVLDRLTFAVDVARATQARSVLDIGCGAGPLFEPLAALGAQVVGIDPAPRMVELAREEARRVGPNVAVVETGWESLGIATHGRTFDLAVALGVFDYVRDADALLTTMAETARWVVASFPRRGLRVELRRIRYGLRGVSVFGYAADELAALVAASGLELDACDPLGRAGFCVAASTR